LGAGDHVLLGLDLVKDAAVLDAAYNDAAGVTSAFTRNLFVRMNQELGTRLDLEAIEHLAWYDAATDRVVIHARFTRPTTLVLPEHGRTFRLAAGELVLTEISFKFRVPVVTALAARHGFDLVRTFGGDAAGFALALFRRRPRPTPPRPGVVAEHR